ncbi:MAG: glycosyltransferase family 4 protein [Candidatus Cloacimonadota bacterium]|nr:glycosyltransferase family 4 protein [Candidatus Cloacimonadota bacterium]
MVLENDFPPDIRVEKEIKTLINAGYEVILACSSSTTKDSISSWRGATIIKKRMPKFIYKTSAICLEVPIYFNFWHKFLEDLFSEYKFDAIHLHDLPLIKVIDKLSKKYNVPYLLDLHENRPEVMKTYEHVKSFPGNLLISPERWKGYEEKFIRNAKTVLVVTNEAKDYYIKQLSLKDDNIHVISNFIDLKEFSNFKLDLGIVGKCKDKFSVVYLGDTGSRRGTIDILKVANVMRDKNNDIEFIIIGTSKIQKKLHNLVKKWDLKNVRLNGWLPLSVAYSYLIAAKVGICPLHRNIHHDTTYANKIFHYMAAKLPVLVSDCEAQAKVVRKEDCGLVFEAENVEDMKEKIMHFYLNPQDIKRMGLNGEKAVLEKYNWEKEAAKLRAIYKNLE